MLELLRACRVSHSHPQQPLLSPSESHTEIIPSHWVTVGRDEACGCKVNTLVMANTGNMVRQKINTTSLKEADKGIIIAFYPLSINSGKIYLIVN